MNHRMRSSGLLRLGSILLIAAAALTGAWWVVLQIAPPADPYRARPAGRQVFARDGTLLRGTLSADEKLRFRTPLREIGPEVVRATLEHEDRWFYRHPGVNPVAAARAAWTNLRCGEIRSGASTITMQLAKLIDRPRGRSWMYKIMQTFHAMQYESIYSKDEILEMYLNLAPYGGNVEGVAASSHVFFGKPPRDLSAAEAALLAVLPQSPATRNPIRNPDRAREARNRLLDRLARRGLLSSGAASEAKQRPLPREIHPLPFLAPQFGEWILRSHPDVRVPHTTLDVEIQQAAQQSVRAYVGALQPTGIGQGAAVILDAERSEVLALVGSADFDDSVRAGQVNGAVALRSPGSTLKPFIYAMAIDRGLITPGSLLEDVPISFGSFAPGNYDDRFEGVIRADRALQTSRNVPAVLLEERIERETGSGLYRFLREAGVESLRRPESHYGLSLVLGGGDITLMDLASLYATLARQGIYRPLRVLHHPGAEVDRTAADDDSAEEAGERRLFSAEAAYLVLDILTDVSRPDLASVWRSGTHQISIPWKTGTSFGHRDAWAIGIAGRYVVAVWLGNFDGTPCPLLVGHDAAGPLLFDLIALLPKQDPGTWHIRPPRVQQREVCALSGAPATASCPARAWQPCIAGISSMRPCTVHRRILVDTESGREVCSRCRVTERYRQEAVVWWPPEVATYITAGDLPRASVPAHNPACEFVGIARGPSIVSPLDGMEYHVRADAPLEDQGIPLAAAADHQTAVLYWFVDGTLLRKAAPDTKVFLEPIRGSHRLTVRDELGRSASVTIRVIDESKPAPAL